MVLNGLLNGPYHLQLAAGWTGLLVRINAVMAVVFLPTTWLLTVRYGMTGAAVSWVLINLAYVVTVARLMHKRLLTQEMGAWYTRDLLMPLAAAVSAGLLLKLTVPAPTSSWSTVALLVVGLMGIYGFASIAANSVRAELGANLRLLMGRSA
jgi:O-antigen/teichoic acid export membrane protein